MNRFFVRFFGLIFVSMTFTLAAPTGTTPVWQLLGPQALTINTNNLNSSNPSLALDSKGNPTVAWSEDTSTESHVFVKHWDGEKWDLIGSTFIDENKGGSQPSVTLDSSGNPTVAWVDFSGSSFDIFVKHWDGRTWNFVGDTYIDVAPDKAVGAPSIVNDSKGNPIVAWTEDGDDVTHVFVKRWNGSSWALVGTSSLETGRNRDALDPKLRTDAKGNLTVAWDEGPGPFHFVYVKRWNGNSWKFVGDTYLNTKIKDGVFFKALALDSKGLPIAAWIESNFEKELTKIQVRRWDGSTWKPIGTTEINVKTRKNGVNPLLEIDPIGTPILVMNENDGTSDNLFVKRWDGKAWTAIGKTFLDTLKNSSAFNPSMALDAKGNPVVAWDEFDGTYSRVYVKRSSRTP
jgi:hypothetical protein